MFFQPGQAQPVNAYSSPLSTILIRRKQLRRELIAASDALIKVRIVVLGGTTTIEFVQLLEILLLQSGFRPDFVQSDYGRYYEDALFETKRIAEFKPDLVYVHTCSLNISTFPSSNCTEQEFAELVEMELIRYRSIWESIADQVGCQIIQNNFELPLNAIMGNLDAVNPGGASRFVHELNRRFAQEAASSSYLTLQDLCGISARIGLDQWFDPGRWFRYRIANSVDASFALALSIASLVRAMHGRSKKVLVLDLDNTLWGGTIGDDGVDGIVLGRENAVGEAYLAFQNYCLSLRNRGILLAVCSKNDEANAKAGFTHPDSVLKLGHFSAFKANWRPKPDNILAIAEELNLGLDSFVFVDDTPAERALIESEFPGIAVPDIGQDVTRFATVIDSHRYFEQTSIGSEDFLRANRYQQLIGYSQLQHRFVDYGDYLDSLHMTAEVHLFDSSVVDRIAQLTNKTNQFNLTTRRYTPAEISAAMASSRHLGIYGRLADRFSDHGIVSVVLGSIEQSQIHLDLWAMSCRALKREMELAMLDRLVEHAKKRNIRSLIGYYVPSAKNSLVIDHYQHLGFVFVSLGQQEGSTIWSLDITSYRPRSHHIQIKESKDE